MANARIQFSTADEQTWQTVNPTLREGELVLSMQPSGKYKMKVGGPGGSEYNQATLVWDEASAEATRNAAQTAQNAAEDAVNEVNQSIIATRQNANAAAQSATEAANTIATIRGYRDEAKTSETNAKASENKAATSESIASGAATRAANSASEASEHKTNAQASATAAKESEDLAKQYRDEAFEATPAGYEELTQHVSALSAENVKQSQRISVLEGFHKNDDFTYEQIQEIANNEQLETYFPVGTQFNLKWRNTVTNVEYDAPLDVVHHGYFLNENGETKKGMILQWHYCAYSIQFSNYQAFYKAETELPAGTYYITWGQTWGSHGATKDVSYSFTLTQPVKAGGFLAGFRTMADTDSANWKVYNYASAYDQNPVETVNVVQGANGTNLGTLAYYTVGNLNGMQQTGYGYNNYKQSAIRQWLNSTETKGNWWQSKNKYDMRPDQLFTYDGFMCGFDDGFLNLVSPVQQNIATNTVTDSGVTDVVCDKFWLPSLEQEYCVPQVKGVEGEYWEYWKDRLQLDSPQQSGSANANTNHIRYAMENHNSAQIVRLRSAYRSYSFYTWSVSAAGLVYNGSSCNALRCAPACAIISKS